MPLPQYVSSSPYGLPRKREASSVKLGIFGTRKLLLEEFPKKLESSIRPAIEAGADRVYTGKLAPLFQSGYQYGLLGSLIGGGIGLGSSLLSNNPTDDKKKKESPVLNALLGGLLGGGLGVLYGLYRQSNPSGSVIPFLTKSSQAGMTKEAYTFLVPAAIELGKFILLSLGLSAADLGLKAVLGDSTTNAINATRQDIATLRQDLVRGLTPLAQASSIQMQNNRIWMGHILPYGALGGALGGTAAYYLSKKKDPAKQRLLTYLGAGAGALSGALMGSNYLPAIPWWKPFGLQY